MKYWLLIDSWNLMESFVTESISPYSFYQERSFGNNLSRFFKVGSEKINHLILSTREPMGEYAVEISDELLDVDLLIKSGKKKTVFTYPKTIYYRKGLVRFRFFSREKQIAFIAESKILLEVKCIEKYLNDFYFDNKAKVKISEKSSDAFLFEKQQYLSFDNKYNSLKGAFVGYVRGQLTSMDNVQQELLSHMTELKNSFTGLHTELMLGEDAVHDVLIFQKIFQCKLEYSKLGIEATNLFDILSQVFKEVVKLASMRSQELKRQKTPAYEKEIEGLKQKREKCAHALNRLEDVFNFSYIKDELNQIKQKEIENGEKKGKKREYFKKETPEYKRKVELKKMLDDFEENKSEYKTLKQEIKIIEERIDSYHYGSTEYDSALGALFVRLSDGVNDLIKKVNKSSQSHFVDFSRIKIVDEKMMLRFGSETVVESVYLNIVLQYILEQSLGGARSISEIEILNLILATAKIFRNTEYSKTVTGQELLVSLGQYWRYKKQELDTFSIPSHLPIFQSIMSFFIKPQGFEQIERFMLNRKYRYKEYAFMLWGAYIGFAAIPKTFTSVIYQNDEIDKELDYYLNDILVN